MPSGRKTIDVTGEKFGRWTALEMDRLEDSRTFWIAECECGHRESVEKSRLLNARRNDRRCMQCHKERMRLGNTRPITYDYDNKEANDLIKIKW